MRDFISYNKVFIFLAIAWYLIGKAFSPVAIAFIVLCALFFKLRNNVKYMLFGMLTLIFMSDIYRFSFLAFAGDLKDAYCLLLFLNILIDADTFKPYSDFYKPFLPFFILLPFISLINPFPILSLTKAFSYVIMFIVYPNYILAAYRKEGDDFIRDFYHFLFFPLLVSLLLIRVLPHDVAYVGTRFNGILGNPNGMGLYTALLIGGFMVINDLKPGLFSGPEKLLNLGIAGTVLILTGSRNALFCVLITLVLGVLFRRSLFLGSIFAIVSISAFNIITEALVTFINAMGLSEFYRLNDLEQGSGRLIAWSFAWEHIQDNWFFGQGFGYTVELYEKYYHYLSMKGHQGNAHNSYLTFWLDTGIVGVILLMRGLILAFFKLYTRSFYILPFFISVLFSMFFESWFTSAINPDTFQVISICTFAGILVDEAKRKEQAEAEEPVTKSGLTLQVKNSL